MQPGAATAPVLGERREVRIGAELPWWLVIGTLAVVGGLLPLLLTDHFGVLGIPRGDDVAYLGSAYRVAEHGVFDGGNWASMNLVGLLAFAVPIVRLFGHDIEALRVAVAALGVGGLVALYDLGRHVTSSRRSLLVAVMVAVGPIWLATSVRFYTDVPAFALAMASLALGARALTAEGIRKWMLAASLLCGFLGFTVRDHALAAPIAVGVVAIWTGHDRVDRRAATAMIAAFGAACAAFLVWQRGLPAFKTQALSGPAIGRLDVLVTTHTLLAILLALFVAPAVLLVGPSRLVRAALGRAPRTTVVLAGLVTGSLLLDLAISGRTFRALDDQVDTQFTLLGARVDVVAPWVVALLAVVGVAIAVALVCFVVPAAIDALAALRHGHIPVPASRARAIVGVATACYIGGLAVLVLLGATLYERYYLPVVPLVAVLVLSRRDTRTDGPNRRARTAAVGSLVVLAAFSVAVASTTASFDATKWELATEAARAAGSRSAVNGGFEWINARAGRAVHRIDDDLPRWCMQVRKEATRPSGSSLVASRRIWTVGTGLWVTVRRTGPCRDVP